MVRYLTDSQGERTSVVISIADWNRLSKLIQQMDSLEYIANSVKNGILEAKVMEENQAEPRETAKEFLDAL